ncbi:MAG: hypothetical protein ACREBD_19120 [Blastocatellia bacterium]
MVLQNFQVYYLLLLELRASYLTVYRKSIYEVAQKDENAAAMYRRLSNLRGLHHQAA